MSRKEPPMQPIVKAKDGVVRFQKNEIVSALLDWATPRGFDMNLIARMKFPRSDKEQFAQLIGYSVSGFGDLPYARPSIVAMADKKADDLK